MTTHVVRRIPLADNDGSGKSLEVRITELCDLMATAGYSVASSSAVEGQLIIIFHKNN